MGPPILLLLPACLLQGCGTLSQSLWEDAVAAETLTATATLQVEAAAWNLERDALTVEFTVRDRDLAGETGRHLPPRGWLQLHSRGQDNGLGARIAADTVSGLDLYIEKHRRGPKNRGRAGLTAHTDGEVQHSRWNATLSLTPPPDELRPLPPDLVGRDIRFALFERDSRAWLVSRALLLSLPYAVADGFSDEEIWGDFLGSLIEGAVDGAVDAAFGGSSSENYADTPRRHNRRQPTGPPTLRPRRIKRVADGD